MSILSYLGMVTGIWDPNQPRLGHSFVQLPRCLWGADHVVSSLDDSGFTNPSQRRPSCLWVYIDIPGICLILSIFSSFKI